MAGKDARRVASLRSSNFSAILNLLRTRRDGFGPIAGVVSLFARSGLACSGVFLRLKTKSRGICCPTCSRTGVLILSFSTASVDRDRSTSRRTHSGDVLTAFLPARTLISSCDVGVAALDRERKSSGRVWTKYCCPSRPWRTRQKVAGAEAIRSACLYA